MNEELQKELLAILRSMREGAPDAWHELVAQRSTYCLTTGISMLAISVIVGIIGAALVWACRKGPFDEPGSYTLLTRQAAGMIVGCTTMLCAGLVIGTSVIPMLAEGFAPLGRVLEAIR